MAMAELEIEAGWTHNSPTHYIHNYWTYQHHCVQLKDYEKARV